MLILIPYLVFIVDNSKNLVCFATMVLKWGDLSINGPANAVIGAYLLMGGFWEGAVAQNGPVKVKTCVFWS